MAMVMMVVIVPHKATGQQQCVAYVMGRALTA